MKKLFILLLSVCLCGCSFGKTDDPVLLQDLASRPFTAQGELCWMSEQFDCQITRSGQGSLSCDLKSDTLADGLTMSLDNGAFTVLYGDLSLTLPADSPSAAESFPLSLEQALSALSQTPCIAFEDGISISGDGGYSATMSKDFSALLTLEMPNGSIMFNSFEFGENAFA